MEKEDKKLEENPLEKLKEDYLVIQKKYDLPTFEDLNKYFWIEKVSESETDFLIREIGKVVADKFSNYLRFVEMFLNPVNAPMFVFTFAKILNEEDKNKLSEIYQKMVKIELQLIELDVEFNEEKEVEFVKEGYLLWKEIGRDLIEIFEKVKLNLSNKEKKTNKGYFG